MAKRANSVCAFDFDAAIGCLEWTFQNGDVVRFTIGPRSDFPTLTEQQYTALVHGFKQKIGDAMAIQRDPKSGKSATPETKRAAMQKVVDVLNAGGWRGMAIPDLVQAIADVTGKPISEIHAKYKLWNASQRDAMAENPKYAPRIAELRGPVDMTGIEKLDAEIDAI